MKELEVIDELFDKDNVPPKKRKPLLADICGISYQAVKAWYDGKSVSISYANLAKIADYFGVSVAYLNGEKEDNNTRIILLMKKFRELGIEEIAVSQLENLLKAFQASK